MNPFLLLLGGQNKVSAPGMGKRSEQSKDRPVLSAAMARLDGLKRNAPQRESDGTESALLPLLEQRAPFYPS